MTGNSIAFTATQRNVFAGSIPFVHARHPRIFMVKGA